MPADLHRREFLTGAAASAFLAAVHGPLARAEPGRAVARGDGGARLLGLRLSTAAPLAEMKAFYHRLMGLAVAEWAADRLTIQAGATRITFITAEPEGGQPFYHFAFNIPENKIRLARAWQLERTPLLPAMRPWLRDPDYPHDVTHFESWNAHSVFFWDPAGNLVEHIARHDLKNSADGPFTPDDVLCASEIGFVVDDVPRVAEGLRQALELGQYRPESKAFSPLGDEHGLLLVFRRGRQWWGKSAEVFGAEAEIRGAAGVRYAVPGLPYAVTAGPSGTDVGRI